MKATVIVMVQQEPVKYEVQTMDTADLSGVIGMGALKRAEEMAKRFGREGCY